jgi:hypothetical protein
LVVLACSLAHARQAASGPDIRGGWQAETYALKSGERHALKGQIVFTASDWSVTFLITPEGQAPQRASAEGGTYTLEGTNLGLRHLYNFSAGGALPGLPASPLRMTVNEPAQALLEPCTVTVEGERLTLAFPSGNSMSFQRSSRF